MEPLFSVNHRGVLTYAPFAGQPGLPQLVVVNEAERRRDTSQRLMTLAWPGAVGAGVDDSLPLALVTGWGVPGLSVSQTGRASLEAVVAAGLPHEVPDCVAYHLAVNHERYGVLRPVAGLPGEAALAVLARSQFKVDAKHLGAAQYLQFLAESHCRHPLLRDFDTHVRERYLELSQEATRLYFFTLGEQLVDVDAGLTWPAFAGYLFWVGRTGRGVHAQGAGLDAKAPREAPWLGCTQDALVRRLAAWHGPDHALARLNAKLSRVA
jgi:hypothetical protein